MLETKFTSSILSITSTEWNSVCNAEFPFIRHEFLAALEQSGVVSTENGWKPNHLLIYDNSELIAVMPGYLKNQSYGEFVFDFQWADAYRRNGMRYYPKYISAIPFSPVTGPRLCVRKTCGAGDIVDVAVQAIKQFVFDHSLSSWHLLFPEQFQSELFSTHSLLTRKAVHFQWRNQGYQNFDHFLDAFNSRKRKNLRKERQKIAEQNISLERIEGRDITGEQWERFYLFYQLTYAKRSGHGGYLNRDFFTRLSNSMSENLLMVLARKNEHVIAAALNLKDSTALYGRYWGCDEEYDFLHFETCYYQGIEYCIEKKLQRFDPGVQGEHKIQRGFEPVYTYSNHWIADANFRDAIADFLAHEEKSIALYKQQAEALLPFKAG